MTALQQAQVGHDHVSAADVMDTAMCCAQPEPHPHSFTLHSSAIRWSTVTSKCRLQLDLRVCLIEGVAAPLTLLSRVRSSYNLVAVASAAAAPSLAAAKEPRNSDRWDVSAATSDLLAVNWVSRLARAADAYSTSSTCCVAISMPTAAAA